MSTIYSPGSESARAATVRARQLTDREKAAVAQLSDENFETSKSLLEGIVLDPDDATLQRLMAEKRTVVNICTYLYPAVNNEDGRFGPGIPDTYEVFLIPGERIVSDVGNFFRETRPEQFQVCSYVPEGNLGAILQVAGLLDPTVGVISEGKHMQLVVGRLIENSQMQHPEYPGFELQAITQPDLNRIASAYGTLYASLKGRE